MVVLGGGAFSYERGTHVCGPTYLVEEVIVDATRRELEVFLRILVYLVIYASG